MSVWGKLIGVATGLALGGPIGAILGLAAGYGVDKASNYRKENRFLNSEEKEQVFAFGVIALAAKLSKADGQISKEEIVTFKRLFDFPKEDEKAISKLFNASKENTHNYKDIAEQIYSVFKSNKPMLFELLNSLFAIAYADNHFHEKEEEMLREIGKIFKFNEQDFQSINNLFIKKGSNISEDINAYFKVLGLKKESNMDEVSIKYKSLIKEYHPDRLQGLGLPKDFIQLANKKLSIINEAYSAIKNAKKVE